MYKFVLLYNSTFHECYVGNLEQNLLEIISHSCKRIGQSPLKHEDYPCILNATYQNIHDNYKAPCIVGICSSGSLSGIGQISVITVCSLVLLFGALANGAVGLFFGQKGRRTKTDIFLISLSLADLVACVAGPLESIISFTCPYTKWEFDQTSTYVILLIIGAIMAISSWTLAAISVDRYWAIVRPFASHRIKDKRRMIVSLLIWLVAFLASYTFQFNEDLGMHGFVYDIYSGILVCAAWLVPLVVVGVMYGICINRLRRSNLKHSQNETMKRRNAENKRIIKMFIVITILFFATTLPAIVVGLVYPVSDQSGKTNLARMLSNLILFLGSAINPLVYAKMHRELRGFFVKIKASIVPHTSRKQQYSFRTAQSALSGIYQTAKVSNKQSP